MRKENIVYLLVGQRGAGKSEYSRKLLVNQPHLKVISRDEILVRLMGSETCDLYSGGIEFGVYVMHRLLHWKLHAGSNLRLVLDSFTGNGRERKALIGALRKYGADKVVALYFITPLQIVNEWFWLKPGIARTKDMRNTLGGKVTYYSDDAAKRDHKIFHQYAKDIDRDGFDEVIRVNPLDPLIILL